jgi:hypothetical protein
LGYPLELERILDISRWASTLFCHNFELSSHSFD